MKRAAAAAESDYTRPASRLRLRASAAAAAAATKQLLLSTVTARLLLLLLKQRHQQSMRARVPIGERWMVGRLQPCARTLNHVH